MRVQEISQENSFLVPLLANEHDVLLELEKNMLWEMGRKRIYLQLEVPQVPGLDDHYLTSGACHRPPCP